MIKQKVILLKITGEFFGSCDKDAVNPRAVREIARHIKMLKSTHYFGIVVGGGNFFRGLREGKALEMSHHASDQVGILATLMNGIILQDLFAQEGVDAHVFSAIECPTVASLISPQDLASSMRTKDCVIFVGGTGNPYFTTDTTCIIRALQIKAEEVWKATKIGGVYTSDPKKDTNARFIPRLTCTEALAQNLGIVDETAFILARKYHVTIRIFSLFDPQALLRAATEESFGSTIVP